MSEESSADKRAIRATVRAKRQSASAQNRSAARDALTRQLVDLVTQRGATSFSCYLPTPDEPDTTGFLAWAREQGAKVLLPVSQQDRTILWARQNDAEPVAGLHGILEPAGERLPTEAAASLDLMIIPACAVDATGTRLGWGLGYYDRCLSSLSRVPPVYAVVFDDELLPLLPRDAHDAPIAGVVTPSGVREFPQR